MNLLPLAAAASSLWRRRRRTGSTSVQLTVKWILIASLVVENSAHKDVYCRAVDIRNSPEMTFGDNGSKEGNVAEREDVLRTCTVMEGDFTIAMITGANVTHSSFPTFQNLRVITGSLLIFQVIELRSLQKILPKLRVIGGQKLIVNYALVIFQNSHIKKIGLNKLTTIINGGVRIVDNSQLCYSRYIDWKSILIGPANDVLVDQSKSASDPESCTNECVVDNVERCSVVDFELSCWDENTCQLKCDHIRNEDGVTIGPGCDDLGQRCHEQCLGGCSIPGDATACHYCKNVIHDGECVESCPEGFYELHHVYLVRRCVSKQECLNISAPTTDRLKRTQMLIVDNQCRADCPSGKKIDPSGSQCVECVGYCPVKCEGLTISGFNHVVDLIFQKCNVIEGHLEIELRSGLESAAIEKLSQALSSIEVIKDYLLVDFSTSLISLNMFKNLKLIKGERLWRNRYALAVFENPNLRQIFDIKRRSLEIGNGTVMFQNNRMLCYARIQELISHVGLVDVTDNDVSPYSNGDRAICNETTFNLTVMPMFSSSALLSWTTFNRTDMDHRKFLGYQIFYKKVDGPDPNLNIDDNRSACSDSWQMQFESEKVSLEDAPGRGSGAVVSNLSPDTWYAFYIQTKMINHPGARNAISEIAFMKTLFDTPDPPKDLRGKSSHPNEISLKWDPPERPNGEITHYTVKWRVVDEEPVVTRALICDDKAGIRRHHYNRRPKPSGTVSVLNSEQPTCSKLRGCCECKSLKNDGTVETVADEGERLRDTEFENAVQNHVFVQQDMGEITERSRRARRMIEVASASGHISMEKAPRERNNSKQIFEAANATELTLTYKKSREYGDETLIRIWISKANESISEYEVDPELSTLPHKINVTTRKLTLKGLKHFTEYEVLINACQNVSAPGGYHCSVRPAWVTARTAPVPANDLVNNATITLTNNTDSEHSRRSRKITWEEPSLPNGLIHAYMVKVISEDREQTPLTKCVQASDFRKDGGVEFLGLHDGTYRVEVRTISEAALMGLSTEEAAVAYSLFTVEKPVFFTWKVILLIAGIIFLVLTIGALILYYFSRKIFGEKVREYIQQQISANPEYLSQMDVYKPDEWELNRNDIKLEEEIGRGTFGKVYRGYANDVVSHGGVHFGECAVKTVTECANSAERLHFLIEASVMKQFHTSFIVKLYGVVSDGQPVLVVMELMKKGNLRDYLRSRRPDTEENINNLSIPTHREYIRWAAQIADGMAYLESLKFCHRDLAARNCMVNADDTVKIGDFGMARDIYYHEYYKPTGKRLMPVRWMAPESLKDGKFTMKSDVWSYGIVLYEMLTLAQQPYSGIGNEEVFNYIGVSRRILGRPRDCPDFWYDLMVRCWKYDPRDRPDFAEIVAHLLPYTDEEFVEASFVAQTIGKTFDDAVADETLQPEEIYPMTDSAVNQDLVPGDDDDKEPICNSNRRNFGGTGWRRGVPADENDSGHGIRMEEDEL